MDNECKCSDLVKSFDKSLLDLIDHSPVSNYIYNYLSDLKAKTVVIENNYVDKDYLIDYAKFYSRSFNVNEKFTCRYHFFSNEFNEEDFKEYLINGQEDDFKFLNSHYLGFTVVKPIKNKFGEKLIGKTLLKTYDCDDGDSKRIYLKQKYKVSLFGIPLCVDSLPFQTQDSTVGGCATIACWVSVYPLSQLFGTELHSPYEVTEKSVSYPSDSRNFPSKGLTLFQIKNYFKKIGMDTEFIDPSLIDDTINYTSSDDIIADAIKAYISMGLPIVAALYLKTETSSLIRQKKRNSLFRKQSLKKRNPLHFAYHAVVISGYKHKNGKITEIYLHDDNIGPYCRAYPISNFNLLDYEYLSDGFSEILVDKLLIPVYPKIRLSFINIYPPYLESKRRIETLSKGIFRNSSSDDSLNIVPELFLTDVKMMKKRLLKKDFQNKIEILQKPFPRFLWNINLNFHGNEIIEYIYDATDVHANFQFETIDHVVNVQMAVEKK